MSYTGKKVATAQLEYCTFRKRFPMSLAAQTVRMNTTMQAVAKHTFTTPTQMRVSRKRCCTISKPLTTNPNKPTVRSLLICLGPSSTASCSWKFASACASNNLTCRHSTQTIGSPQESLDKTLVDLPMFRIFHICGLLSNLSYL